MDVLKSSVVAIQIALTECEAQDFIINPSAVQKRVYELLFPVNAKAPKSKRAPKAAASGTTLICTTCGRTFKYRAHFNKHVAGCVNVDTAAAS
jgi:hypothetical protein